MKRSFFKKWNPQGDSLEFRQTDWTTKSASNSGIVARVRASASLAIGMTKLTPVYINNSASMEVEAFKGIEVSLSSEAVTSATPNMTRRVSVDISSQAWTQANVTEFAAAQSITAYASMTPVEHRMDYINSSDITASSTISADAVTYFTEVDTIPGLELWLDGSDLSSMYDSGGSNITSQGQSINRWDDVRGGVSLYAESTLPTLSKDALLGSDDSQPLVYFDGTQVLATGAGGVTGLDLITSTDFTIFTVARSLETDPAAAATAVCSYYGGPYFRAYHSPSSYWAVETVNDNPSSFLTYATDADDARMQFNILNNSGSQIDAIAFNDSTVLSSDSYDTSPENPLGDGYSNDKVSVGANYTGSAFGDHFTGYVAEVLIYNRSLNATEEANVREYLANKWS